MVLNVVSVISATSAVYLTSGNIGALGSPMSFTPTPAAKFPPMAGLVEGRLDSSL